MTHERIQRREKTGHVARHSAGLLADSVARTAAPEARPGIMRNAGPVARLGAPLQPKLAVGQPDHPAEVEADHVAEQVARAPAPLVQRCGAGCDCAACRTRQAQPVQLSRTASNAASSREAPSIVGDALRSPGQPLAPGARALMGARFGHDFGHVRIHTGGLAAASAQAINARAYTVGRNVVFGAGQYAPQTPAGIKLLAHELTHVVQQAPAEPAATSHGASVVMRDLALEPPEDAPEQRELTAAQVQAGLRYNRASYDGESTRLIQDVVGAEQTGSFDEDTVRLVALIQRQYGLVPADGKVGPDTYDFLIRELQAEQATPGPCLTLFQIVGPQPLQFFRTSSTRGVINSRFEIHARFDPRCNCGDYEYRQYIGGHVELLETAQPGVTPPATSGCAVLDSVLPGIWVWNMDRCFQIPGGGLTRRMKEDGDVAVAAGVAGRRYGHRSARPNPADGRDVYSPDRATGCIYEGFDVPELSPVPATPGDSGDVYDWDMRFRGVIQRSDGTIVAEKWWNINSTVAIP